MKTIIESIFTEENFEASNHDFGTIYNYPVESNKTQYWLIIELDDLSKITLQNELYTLCKKTNKDKALEKNISMLVLHKVKDDVELIQLKKEVLNVEEDPYLFKKYVLYYKDSEVISFKEQYGTNTPYKFLKSELVNEHCFSEYKNDPKGFFWQSLLYRLAHKIPFVEIKINNSKGLDSLIDNNKQALQDQGVIEFNDNLFVELDKITTNQLNDISDLNLMNLLYPKEESNGDKNQ